MRAFWIGLLWLLASSCLADAETTTPAETPVLTQDELPTFNEIGVHELGSLKVESHSFLVLPGGGKIQTLDQLTLAQSSAVMIPVHINEVRINRLEMDEDARIVVAPGNNRLRIDIADGYMKKGSILTAQGTPASETKPAGDGRSLSLRFQQMTLENLLIDVRGGSFSDSATVHDTACPLYAGDALVQTGGAGGAVFLELPEDFPSERIQVLLEGGRGRMPCQVMIGESSFNQPKGLDGHLRIVRF